MTTPGAIITFYSYKGGVGRSMAVANVGVLLAQWGYRTLLVDFDLEAPGLDYFFPNTFESLDDPQLGEGAVEILTAAFRGDRNRMIQILRGEPQPLKLYGKTPRNLELLTAGRRDEGYFARVRSLDARSAYLEHDAGSAIEELRAALKAEYDFVLVDSRTGNTEIGGITTVQLPDILCAVFTPTEQAFGGALATIRRAARARQGLPIPRPAVPVLPLPSRIDVAAEFRLSQEWFARMARDLGPVVASWLPRTVRPQLFLENIKLPQLPYFGYGERLPVLEQGTNDPTGLGYAYENVAALLAHRLTDVEGFMTNRDDYIGAASGGQPHVEPVPSEPRVFISSAHYDRDWLDRALIALRPLEKDLTLDIWDDTRVESTIQSREGIEDSARRASLFVVLVSPDYLASDKLMNEVLPVITRQDVPVVPVVVRPCLWTRTPLGQYSGIAIDPTLAEMSTGERDRALLEVAEWVAALAGRVA